VRVTGGFLQGALHRDAFVEALAQKRVQFIA
jgi:hypothetical protein